MNKSAAPVLLAVLGLAMAGALGALLFLPPPAEEQSAALGADREPSGELPDRVVESTERVAAPAPGEATAGEPKRVAAPDAAEDPCGPAPTQAQGLSGTIAQAVRGRAVVVAVVDSQGDELARGTTDLSGQFRLGLPTPTAPEGHQRLKVWVSASEAAGLELGPFDIPTGTWQGIGRHVLMPAQTSVRLQLVQADPSPEWLLPEQRFAEPGAPLAGVEAELRVRVGAAASVARARTDANGQALLEPLPKGSLQLILEGPSFGRQAVSLRGADRGRAFTGGRVSYIEEDELYRVELFGDQRSRRVRVQDEQGRPISGVRLRGTLESDAESAGTRELAVSGRDGIAWVPSGMLGNLEVSRVGYFPLQQDGAALFNVSDLRQTELLSLSRDESVPLAPFGSGARGASGGSSAGDNSAAMASSSQVTLRVLDACGRPIPGARVQLALRDARQRPQSWNTDLDGEASGRLLPGRWVAIATVPSGFSHLGSFQSEERVVDPQSDMRWTIEAQAPPER